MSRPMKYIEKQFERVKVFDLDHVDVNHSIFKEVNSIYNNLQVTTSWLKEIKAFIPSSVLDQIQNVSPVIKQAEVHKQKEDHIEKYVESSFYSKKSSNFSSKLSSSVKGGLFKMGLHSRPTVVRMEGSSASGLELAFNELANLVAPIVKLSQANLQIISFDHIILSFTADKLDERLSEKGLETCLKIQKVAKNIKQQVVLRMGISVGKTESGNLGSNSSRYYIVCGNMVKMAKLLSKKAQQYNVTIVLEANSFQNSTKFVARPLDRVRFNHDHPIFLWELQDKKNEENDEWLYELERSKVNDKYQQYSTVFELLREEYWNDEKTINDILGDVTRGITILEEYMVNHFGGSDVACEKLIKSLKKVKEMNSKDQMKDFLVVEY